MRLFLLLSSCVLSTFLFAQEVDSIPQAKKDSIYELFMQSDFYYIKEESFKCYYYAYEDKKEVVDLLKHMEAPVISFIPTDSGYLFLCTQQKRKTASYGFMKNIDFKYVSPENESEPYREVIKFDWEYKNSYDDARGTAPVIVQRISYENSAKVYLKVRIEVEPNKKREKFFRKKYTLFLHATRINELEDELSRSTRL
jgi:hypothetical protein